MEATATLRPIRLTAIAPDQRKGVRSGRWTAIFASKAMVFHVALPIAESEPRDEAEAYAREYAVPAGYELVEG